eukprot:TRINITY_DN12134_c0_g1_i1.p1 TRINITY_DN12134_c0_g1~~TRINITY_DN12134_c0_g1_i1.p1  ORF type:complete len:340 (+),score=111.93 TRINITY_DN12134_c0_g1_i1:58-1077(+)
MTDRPPRCCRCGGKVEARNLGAGDVYEGLYTQSKAQCKALAGTVGDLQTELQALQEKYSKLKRRYKREREEVKAYQAREDAGAAHEALLAERDRADAAERKLSEATHRQKDLLHRYREALRTARDEANRAALENGRLKQAVLHAAQTAQHTTPQPLPEDAPPSPTASSLEHEAELSREWRTVVEQPPASYLRRTPPKHAVGSPPAQERAPSSGSCSHCGDEFRPAEARVELDAAHTVHKRCRYSFMKAQTLAAPRPARAAPRVTYADVTTPGDDNALRRNPPVPYPYGHERHQGRADTAAAGSGSLAPSSPPGQRETSINADLLQLESDLAELQKSLLN